MMKTIGSFIVFLFIPCIAMGGELKPFTTDACSAFPNGNSQHQSLWASCCIRHDLAYWKGGTYEQRLEADKNLASCVSKVGEPQIAVLMLAGVRVGGSPYYPTPYRWGYGWPYPRGYGPLSKDEKQEVRQKLDYFKLMINALSEELK